MSLKNYRYHKSSLNGALRGNMSWINRLRNSYLSQEKKEESIQASIYSYNKACKKILSDSEKDVGKIGQFFLEIKYRGDLKKLLG